MELINISGYNKYSYEKSLIELFQNLGYSHYYGPEIDGDHKNPLFIANLGNIYSINSDLVI